MVLYEGRNRQIRRMCEMLSLEVIRLRRVSMGGLKLGMLAPGKWRALSPKEVKQLMVQADIKSKDALKYTKSKGVPSHDRNTSR